MTVRAPVKKQAPDGMSHGGGYESSFERIRGNVWILQSHFGQSPCAQFRILREQGSPFAGGGGAGGICREFIGEDQT